MEKHILTAIKYLWYLLLFTVLLAGIVVTIDTAINLLRTKQEIIYQNEDCWKKEYEIIYIKDINGS